MRLRWAVAATLRSKRFWLWEVAGAIIYAIPVAIRFFTKNVTIPILDFPGFWVDHYIPGNLLEKILVNSFFPGGAGGVAGEILARNYKCEEVKGKKKYLARLGGALLQTAVWSAFQFWGNMQNITGPYGGNVFEYPMVYPLNFLLASLSIFTPDVLSFAKTRIKNFSQTLLEKRS